MSRFDASTDLLRTSMAAFVVAQVMPFCFVDGGAEALRGWRFLMGGMMEVSHGNPAWLGYPCLFAAWALLLRARFAGAVQFSAAALAAGLTFLLADSVTGANGSRIAVTGLGMGYFAVLASQTLALGAAGVAVYRMKR